MSGRSGNIMANKYVVHNLTVTRKELEDLTKSFRKQPWIPKSGDIMSLKVVAYTDDPDCIHITKTVKV
jgi:hypothetical protein